MTTVNLRHMAKQTVQKILGRGRAYNLVRSAAVHALRRNHEPWMTSVGNTYRILQLRSHAAKELGREEIQQLKEVIESGTLFRGPKLAQFQREFAEMYGAQHAVASTSGTAAIHVAMGMIDPDPGDEIIVPPITDMGTIIPLLYQNTIPVFADIDPLKWTLDPISVEQCITPRTRAIVVVHIFGGLADMDALLEIGKRHRIPVIEDCAQAHLAQYDGRYVGTIGDIGCFSFQQTKQMTTGEGGMTITDNAEYAARGRLFVDKGWDREAQGAARQYTMLGTNYRMTELQAGVGLAQLRKIPGIAERRHRNGTLLAARLREVDGLTPQYVREQDRATYYNFCFTVHPDAPFTAQTLVRVLTERGIPASTNYIGKPIFQCSEPFRKRQFYGQSHFPFDYPGARTNVRYDGGSCPIAEDVLRRLVGISMTERYSEKDVHFVADEIERAVERLSRHVQTTGWKTPTSVGTLNVGTLNVGTRKRTDVQTRDRVSPVASLKAAIIGCGAISRDHAMAYRALGETSLEALADVSPDALKSIASEFAVPRTYTDFHEMLAREHLDIVSIATWPGLHAEMTIAAAEQGVSAIFCEKPMALNLGEADKMIRACERHGVKLVISHQFRFNPHINKVRELVATGAIGHPELVWGHWDSSLLNRGTHVIDAIRYVLGDPEAEWVLGQAVRQKESFNRGHPVEEIAQGLIGFRNGSRALLESGELAPNDFLLHIYGDEGQIQVGLDGLTLRTKRSHDTMKLEGPKEHQATIAEMIRWMQGQTDSHPGSADQARKDLELLMAIFESSRTRNVVRLPLETTGSPYETENG